MLYFAIIATDNKADMISSTPCLPCFLKFIFRVNKQLLSEMIINVLWQH